MAQVAAVPAPSVHAIELEEVTRRPPSLGLVAKIVALTIFLGGAVLSFGIAWGRTSQDGASSLRALQQDLARQQLDATAAKAELKAESSSAAERLKLLEHVAGGLTPAVDRLGDNVGKLAATVDALRTTVTEQTVEMRHVKETLQRLEAAKPPK